MILSVVVADVSDDPITLDRTLISVHAELSVHDEVVCVHRSEPPACSRRTTMVSAPTGANRGELYAMGLSAARHDFVAFTDSYTDLQDGWRSAVVAAMSNGAKIVGGPVLTSPGSLRSTAGFLVEYGPHAVAPFRSAKGDVAANNVAYERASLEEVMPFGAPLWKSVVNAALAAQGDRPVLVTGMKVVSRKSYGWADLTRGRARHGRLYGAQQSRGRSFGRRLARALSCLVVPLVSYGRLATRMAVDPRWRTRLALATPVVGLALVAWTLGEAWGYLMPKEDGRGVL